MLTRNLYLMTTSLAVAGMIGAPLQSYAQDAGQPAYSQSQTQDPPARVGRLATMEGTVSHHTASETQWSPAVLNAPASDGDAYWTEPQGLAEVEVTSSTVWMAESTEFDLTTLNDTAMHAAEPQGELYVHLRSLQPGETYTIETPRGTVTMAAEGRYEIGAGDTQNPTTVTVLDGAAQITGNNISLQVQANQTASVTGATTFEGSVGPLSQDDFLAAMLKREQPVAPRGAAPPPVVAQMTGGEDLNAYGSWDTSADYGNVWYPDVGSDWAPYRDGRWSYDAPWGWTWMDAAPWGFAPFHYGRWVQIGPRWGWAPVYPGYGEGYRPVYAPALVSFFGVGVGVGVGIGVGFGFGLGLGAAFGPGANIGWVPLGPREAYFPPYGASRAYLNRVNVTNIRNVSNIYSEVGTRRGLPIGSYANSRAAVVVPANAMAESRPVNAAFRRPSPTELAGAHGLVDRAPIAPGARTLGLTPRVAQQLNVPNVERSHAPGPQVSAAAERGGRPAQPALREASGPNREPRTTTPAAGAPGPAIGSANRGGGLPGLRQPGARPGNPAGAPGTEPNRAGPPVRPNEAGRPQLRAPGTSPAARPGEVTNRPAATTHEQAPQAHAPGHVQAPSQRPQAVTPRPQHEAAPVRQAAPRPQAAPRRPTETRPPVQSRPQVQSRPPVQHAPAAARPAAKGGKPDQPPR